MTFERKQFSTTRLRPGYDEDEVDAFLDAAELRLAAMTQEGLPADPGLYRDPGDTGVKAVGRRGMVAAAVAAGTSGTAPTVSFFSS